MSVLKEPTLSMIEEASERTHSISEERSSRYVPIAIPDSSPYHNVQPEDPNYHYYDNASYSADGALQIPRASLLSSDTSYGEVLPPGQSAFRSLGLGVPELQYDKSLPSLPQGSASARSGLKSESERHSLAKSESSKHSFTRSEPEKWPEKWPEPVGPILESAKSEHSLRKPASEKKRSTARSASSRHSGSGAGSVRRALVPSAPSSVSSISTSSPSSSTTTVRSSQSSATSMVSSASTIRTFDSVIDEVATSLAVRTRLRAERVDTTHIGVCTTLSRYDDNARFMRVLADKLHTAMALTASYLFALEGPGMLVFCGAPQRLVTKASILAGLRFKTRLAEIEDAQGTWIGHLDPPPVDVRIDEEIVLWDIVRKAAGPIDAAAPPPGSRSVDELLSAARARLDRLSPREAYRETTDEHAMLVDIRPEAQRAEFGGIPGALVIERNVLEWRFDPRSIDGRLPVADRYDLRIIVYCQEGYTSSLAAASLQDIGLWQATDVDGGFARWKREGFPTHGEEGDSHSVRRSGSFKK